MIDNHINLRIFTFLGLGFGTLEQINNNSIGPSLLESKNLISIQTPKIDP